MGFYIYKFLNNNKDVIYIGQTNDIMRRLEKQHFTSRGHLSQECYKETTQVFFAQLPSKTDMDIMERYLIGKYRPKYNEVYNTCDVSLSIIEPKWIKYQKDYAAQKALISQLNAQIATEREKYQSNIMALKIHNRELMKQISELKAENKELNTFKEYYIEQAKYYHEKAEHYDRMTKSSLETYDKMLASVMKIQKNEIELYNDLLRRSGSKEIKSFDDYKFPSFNEA